MAIARSERVPDLAQALIMPIITAIYNAHLNTVLADIEKQFSLDQDTLISITSHFHKLFNLGLTEYGHSMAMMYASSRSPAPCASLTANLSPTFVTGVPDGTETG